MAIMGIPFTGWVAGVAVLNAVLGVLMVLAVFAFMERRIYIAAVGGVILGGAVIYGEATLGEQMLKITVEEMKILVISASMGAVAGVLAAVLTWEPEL